MINWNRVKETIVNERKTQKLKMNGAVNHTWSCINMLSGCFGWSLNLCEIHFFLFLTAFLSSCQSNVFTSLRFACHLTYSAEACAVIFSSFSSSHNAPWQRLDYIQWAPFTYIQMQSICVGTNVKIVTIFFEKNVMRRAQITMITLRWNKYSDRFTSITVTVVQCSCGTVYFVHV